MRDRVIIKLQAEPHKEDTSWGPGRGHMKIGAEENLLITFDTPVNRLYCLNIGINIALES